MDLPLSPEPASLLCAACSGSLFPHEPPYCVRCAGPAPDGALWCRLCAGRPADCRLIRAALRYGGAATSVVHAFKYGGRRRAARVAGAWLARHWARFPELTRVQALVPMPLHPRRQRSRGYNQAALLAEALGDALGLPVLELAERPFAARTQVGLTRSRRLRNLRGTMTASRAAIGMRLAVIDDVCTTGASFEECARALRAAGAFDVVGCALARQWPERRTRHREN